LDLGRQRFLTRRKVQTDSRGSESDTDKLTLREFGFKLFLNGRELGLAVGLNGDFRLTGWSLGKADSAFWPFSVRDNDR
jgi:hypothetical protein